MRFQKGIVEGQCVCVMWFGLVKVAYWGGLVRSLNKLPGQQLGDQGRQKHHQDGRTVLGCTVATVGRTGFAELGLDVGRRLGVDAAIGLRVDVLPGARAGNHHAVVDDLLHLFADGTRLGQLLVERVAAGAGRVAAVHETPAPLLLRDDVLAERIVTEGRRRCVRRASPASQGTGLLECGGH